MILTAEEIKKSVANGEIIIDPFDENYLKSGSYTFKLGNKIRKLKKVDFIDTRNNRSEFEEFEIGENGYLLQPGEFVVCHTKEKVKLANSIACFLSMNGPRAKTGLDALQSEIFCEPGSEGCWAGSLMLETSNRGSYPIKLFPGVKIIKGIFIRL